VGRRKEGRVDTVAGRDDDGLDMIGNDRLDHDDDGSRLIDRNGRRWFLPGSSTGYISGSILDSGKCTLVDPVVNR
jgi:hypothetical protein